MSPQRGGGLAAGLIGGGVAAIAAAGLSIPLESPSDGLLNSGSVAIAAVVGGLMSGILWEALARWPQRRSPLFALALTSTFAGIVIAAMLVETQVERTVSYVTPLAALSLGVVYLAMVGLTRNGRRPRWWLGALAVALGLSLGLGFAGVGDQEDGRLELPPRGESGISTPRYFLGKWELV